MEILFRKIFDRAEKLNIMKECDHAFTISVVGRSFFDTFFDKIDQYAFFWAAFNEKNEVCGYSVFYANNLENKTAFLTLFCIKKNMQHMHLGSRLMNLSIEESRKSGMNKMALEVLQKDEGAIRFYEYCGFRNCGTNNEYLKMQQEISDGYPQ